MDQSLCTNLVRYIDDIIYKYILLDTAVGYIYMMILQVCVSTLWGVQHPVQHPVLVLALNFFDSYYY